jgi:hypothetical protein
MLLGTVVARPVFPPGGGYHTKTGTLLRRFRILIGLPFLVLGAAAFWWMPHAELLWPVGASLLTMWSTITFDYAALSERLGCNVPHEVASLAIFMLCAAYGVGNANAARIQMGTDYLEVQLETPGLAKMRYLGRAGDYVLLWNPVDRVTMVQSLASAQPLRLRHIVSSTGK